MTRGRSLLGAFSRKRDGEASPGRRASAAAVPAAPRGHPLGRDRGLRVEVTSLSRFSQPRALAEKKEPGFSVSEMCVSVRSSRRGLRPSRAQGPQPDRPPPDPAPVKTRSFPTLQNACVSRGAGGDCFVCDLNKTSVVGGSGARGLRAFPAPDLKAEAVRAGPSSSSRSCGCIGLP